MATIVATEKSRTTVVSGRMAVRERKAGDSEESAVVERASRRLARVSIRWRRPRFLLAGAQQLPPLLGANGETPDDCTGGNQSQRRRESQLRQAHENYPVKPGNADMEEHRGGHTGPKKQPEAHENAGRSHVS